MKVIAARKKPVPKLWTRHFRCGSCTSILEVEASDLLRFRSMTPCGDLAWDYAAFVCVECGSTNEAEVSKRVRERTSITSIASNIGIYGIIYKAIAVSIRSTGGF